jgi:hypothetical protein
MAHDGRPEDNPTFFKPVVDHEINLSTGETAKIIGRQISWKIQVEGKTALVYLDEECRLQVTPFGDGTELEDRRALKSFIAGELDALVVSLTRLQ